jgi:hypothetical protein
MNYQLEPFGEKSLEHLRHLLFGGAFGKSGLDVEALGAHGRAEGVEARDLVILHLIGGAN